MIKFVKAAALALALILTLSLALAQAAFAAQTGEGSEAETPEIEEPEITEELETVKPTVAITRADDVSESGGAGEDDSGVGSGGNADGESGENGGSEYGENAGGGSGENGGSEDGESERPYIGSDGKEWYANNTRWNVRVTDEDSGVYSVIITINGQPIPEDLAGEPILDDYSGGEAPSHEQVFLIGTEQIEAPDADGAFAIRAVVTDNAGNVYGADAADTDAVKKIYMDKNEPYISEFAFTAAGYQDAAGEPVAFAEPSEYAAPYEYGYYFREDVLASVTAKDDDDPSSGLSEILIYTEDKDGNKTQVKRAAPPPDGTVTCLIPAEFKGAIFATPIDNVKRAPGAFVRPQGVIAETEAKHAETSAISLTLGKTNSDEGRRLDYSYDGAARADGEPDFRAAENVPLYGADVSVDIVVWDMWSGVRSVKWTLIEAEQAPVVKLITVGADGTLAGDEADLWVKTRSGALVTSLARRGLTLSGNHNDMILLVEMEDRAGNMSYDFQAFGIDKTPPRIAVSYDNNSPDSGKYFDKNRAALITVTDGNFNPALFNANVTADGAAAPRLSEWSVSGGENGGERTYAARLLFSEDADYKVDFSTADRAGNKSQGVAWSGACPQEFTIDKTAPKLSVAYDGGAAQNGNYYGFARLATITVTERNFDPERVKLSGAAEDGGAPVSFPALSGWREADGVHTASIRYERDAKYTFTIALKDKAGNAASPYAGDEFYIDRSEPEIVIDGVTDQSANRDFVMPVVTFTDANLAPDETELKLHGANRGKVSARGVVLSIVSGAKKFAFDDFDRVKAADDFYTLTASATDKAGNRASQTIQFSVNRYGSVYVFDEGLSAALGKYLNAPPEIRFREINVDSLLSDKTTVRVARDGVTETLPKTNYFESRIQDNGAWNTIFYTIPASNFENDGSYAVSVFSVDRAGNENDSAAPEKKAEIAFAVDRTPPVIIVSDLEEGASCNLSEKIVTASVKDNMALAAAAVSVNGEPVQTERDGELYRFRVRASDAKQNVKILATDAAGNETLYETGDFIVAPKFIAPRDSRPPLFAIALACAAAAAFIAARVLKTAKKPFSDFVKVLRNSR